MTARFSSRKFFAASLFLVGAASVLATGLSAGEISPRGRGHGLGILGRAARHLDLTDDQKARIRGVMESHEARLAQQRDARRAAGRALHEATVAEARDEAAIRARAAEVGRVMGDGAVLKARIRSEISPILTGEQRDKLQEMRGRSEERRGRRGGRS